MLHDFDSSNDDGTNAQASLVAAKDGSLWGTTRVGGQFSNGTLYRLAKPIEKFSIKPTTISLGQSAKLKWSSTDTTGCAASGAWGPGALAVSGTQIVTPVAVGSVTYTLACSGAGTATRSVTLTVD